MRRGNVQLQNTDRSHCRFISPREADELVRIERAERVSRKGNRSAVRLLDLPKPSESSSSPACFTLSEMQAFVGATAGGRYAARIKLNYFAPTIRVSY